MRREENIKGKFNNSFQVHERSGQRARGHLFINFTNSKQTQIVEWKRWTINLSRL